MNKSKNMTKQDEIIMSMRIMYIDMIKSEYELKSQTLEELDRMKKDYFYTLSNQGNNVFTIPGPDWKIEGPLDPNSLDIEEFKKLKIEDEGYADKYILEVIKFYHNYKEGDEIYFFKSDDRSWAYLLGIEGNILVRGNKVIDMYITGMN